MTNTLSPGRGIALLGRPGQSTEVLRKIICLQGSAPLVFHTPDDIQALGTRAKHLAMLFVIGQEELANWMPSCRDVIGAAVPMIALAESDDQVAALAAGLHLTDDIAAMPPRLADLYVRIQRLRKLHQRPVRNETPQCGRYRFYPEHNMVGTGGKHVMLTAAMFDFVFELAFHQGKSLSPAWLATVAQRHGMSPEQIHAEISALRQRLGLVPAQGWRLEGGVRSGYRLSNLGGRRETTFQRLVERSAAAPAFTAEATPVCVVVGRPETAKFTRRDFVAFMNYKPVAEVAGEATLVV